MAALQSQICSWEATVALSRPAMGWETFHWPCLAVDGVRRVRRLEKGHLPAYYSGSANGGIVPIFRFGLVGFVLCSELRAKLKRPIERLGKELLTVAVSVARYVAALALGERQLLVRLGSWLLVVSLEASRRPLGQARVKRDISAHHEEVCVFKQYICFFKQVEVVPLRWKHCSLTDRNTHRHTHRQTK